MEIQGPLENILTAWRRLVHEEVNTHSCDGSERSYKWSLCSFMSDEN